MQVRKPELPKIGSRTWLPRQPGDNQQVDFVIFVEPHSGCPGRWGFERGREIWLRDIGLNTEVITSPKIASTMVNAMKSTIRNRTDPFVENLSGNITDRLALLRMDTTSAPKSWTAPTRIDPSKTQTRAGSQPHITAIAGPTIGPVPAMDVKWCPNSTELSVGTKSRSSFSSMLGTEAAGFREKILLASHRP